MTDMTLPLPELPDAKWFELEILYLLSGSERYGNELLGILNDHLGKESISSGKLYSDLKKMEKRGWISRTKRKREKGEGLLTRGVDRIYFEITDSGRSELYRAERYMTSWQFKSLLERSSERIRATLDRILTYLREDSNVGISVDTSKEGFSWAMELLPRFKGLNMVMLTMSFDTTGSGIPSMGMLSKETPHFPARVDDIPLKNGYLDSAISAIPLARIQDLERYISELVRVTKKGGRIVIMDITTEGSYLLENVIGRTLGGSDGGWRSVGIDDISGILSSRLQKVEIKRFGEHYLIWGRKRKPGNG